jgi:hypothetical protein
LNKLWNKLSTNRTKCPFQFKGRFTPSARCSTNKCKDNAFNPLSLANKPSASVPPPTLLAALARLWFAVESLGLVPLLHREPLARSLWTPLTESLMAATSVRKLSMAEPSAWAPLALVDLPPQALLSPPVVQVPRWHWMLLTA